MNISKLMFRSWVYFRTGWSTYFAFIMAGVNTLTITYYLAIEKYPALTNIFPTFGLYVLIIVSIAVPTLALIGYVHFKKSNAFKAEADINIEANPHLRRILSNTELLFPVLIKLLELTTKISSNEKLSEDEIKELDLLKKILKNHMDKHTI